MTRPPRPVLAVSPVVSSVTGKRWHAIPNPKLVIMWRLRCFSARGKAGLRHPSKKNVTSSVEKTTSGCARFDELADVAGKFFVKAFAPNASC